jgi:hypothetical protein
MDLLLPTLNVRALFDRALPPEMDGFSEARLINFKREPVVQYSNEPRDINDTRNMYIRHTSWRHTMCIYRIESADPRYHPSFQQLQTAASCSRPSIGFERNFEHSKGTVCSLLEVRQPKPSRYQQMQ